MKEAILWKKQGERIQCLVCERKCLISPGKRGTCGSRINENGRLYTLTYGHLSAMESRPIEIKPFYHFWPGSSAITISAVGCNFHCPWCQNWHLSMKEPTGEGRMIPPEDVVKMAIQNGDQGTCISFNEPATLFDYMLELFPVAKKRGLYNTIVTNGYFTLEALSMLVKAGLDAARIDIKGGTATYKKWLHADDMIVWRNARYLKQHGVHVEMIYLVIPGVNDNDASEIIEKHLHTLGPDVPLHVNRYYPAYHFSAPPTPLSVIDQIYELARKREIKYVYVGNVPRDKRRNTYCPSCGKLLIERGAGYAIGVYFDPETRKCSCGARIPITGRIMVPRRG